MLGTAGETPDVVGGGTTGPGEQRRQQSAVEGSGQATLLPEPRYSDDQRFQVANPVGSNLEDAALSNIDTSQVAAMAEAFYRDVLHELGEHARRGGSAFGAAVVAKRVARAHGLAAAERLPLPRPTRAELDDLRWDART
jgi:hypothetical protein